MQVIGTEQEIEWAKSMLLNGCEDCPYREECNRTANEEQEKGGQVGQSCEEYLKEKIQFIII